MFLFVPAYPGCTRQMPLNGCVCVCVCVCVGKNYDSACNNVLLDNCAIAFEDSITYLGTLIRAGRTWRTDSSPGRRQCFGAFNSIFC